MSRDRIRDAAEKLELAWFDSIAKALRELGLSQPRVEKLDKEIADLAEAITLESWPI